MLRREGPHPRTVVAAKLGISNSGLARGGITEPLTTAEIKALLVAPPQWLVQERATQAAVRAEKIRVTERDDERASRAAGGRRRGRRGRLAAPTRDARSSPAVRRRRELRRG